MAEKRPPIMSEARGFTVQMQLKPFTLSFRRYRMQSPDSTPEHKEPTIKDLQEKQATFRRARPKFDLKDSGSHLVDRLVEEAEELRSELPKPERHLTLQEKDKVAAELADCLSFVFNIANHYGIDAAIAFYSKMDEVEQRYPAELFQLNDGKTFDEAYAEARRRSGHTS